MGDRQPVWTPHFICQLLLQRPGRDISSAHPSAPHSQRILLAQMAGHTVQATGPDGLRPDGQSTRVHSSSFQSRRWSEITRGTFPSSIPPREHLWREKPYVLKQLVRQSGSFHMLDLQSPRQTGSQSRGTGRDTSPSTASLPCRCTHTNQAG